MRQELRKALSALDRQRLHQSRLGHAQGCCAGCHRPRRTLRGDPLGSHFCCNDCQEAWLDGFTMDLDTSQDSEESDGD
jgi:predicted amidophosphoribosyltransferase